MIVKHYQFFTNKNCEYYPCHDMNGKVLNCLFCYCPLQTKTDCPGILNGDAKYLPSGYKDCSSCTFPHDVENYNKMMDEIDKMIRK